MLCAVSAEVEPSRLGHRNWTGAGEFPSVLGENNALLVVEWVIIMAGVPFALRLRHSGFIPQFAIRLGLHRTDRQERNSMRSKEHCNDVKLLILPFCFFHRPHS
jgi:hypothetical protein